MRSARNLYRVNLTLAAVGALIVLAGAGVALGRADLAPAPVGRLLSDCGSFLAPHLTPAGVALLSLGLLAVVVLARGLRTAGRQIVSARRFLRGLEIVDQRQLVNTRVLLTDCPRTQAFCGGFARPRVYISRQATQLLSPAELAAVVAHEAHHARRRDPLRLLLLAVLGDALFFMPALSRLRRRYAALAELAADEAALATVGDASHLAAALLRFGDTGVEGVVGIDPERVDHLLGASPGWDVPVLGVLTAVATLAALLALVLATAGSGAVSHTSVAQLAAQSCMIAMTVVPIILVLSGLGILGGRQIIRRR